MNKPLRVGATAADADNSIFIWNAFRRWFVEHDLPLEYALYSTYDAMGAALLEGELDIAWNAPMAHVQCLLRSEGECQTLAMRDTDAAQHTLIIARAEAGITDVESLAGKRLALGVEISSELNLIPVSQLQEAGFDPLTRCDMVELEPRQYSDLKQWVDEAVIFDALMAGEADAGAIFEPWLPHLLRQGRLVADDIVEVWRSRPFDHCAFTARPGLSVETSEEFVAVLLSMDPDELYVADMMKREHLKSWVAADNAGWADLITAVENAGLVGKTF